MKNSVKFLLIIITMSVTNGLAYGQSHVTKKDNALEEAKKAIVKSNAMYGQSLVKNDPAIFVNSYAEDACILAPNSPMACGREAITKFFNDGYAAGLRDSKLTTTAVYGDGTDYVTEEGIGRVFDINGKLLDEVKYLVVWKKTQEGWKMFRDAFSSNSIQK
jgi:ketosteroid isomerase-like protein